MNSFFLGLPETQRRRAIEEAAVRQNISAVIMEKDFWVCWMLSVLFCCEYGDSLVFKGGTSLSKVFGAIERFSEDIDLSLSPEFLDLPEPGSSRKQANKWMARAEAACIETVRDRLMPELNQQVRRALSTANDIDLNVERIEFEIDLQTNSPVLLFHSNGQRAITLVEVRAKIVDWKSRFFGNSWARYDLATRGSFRLVPSDSRVDALRQDYQSMREMYLAEPLSFDEVMNQLAALEADINHGARR